MIRSFENKHVKNLEGFMSEVLCNLECISTEVQKMSNRLTKLEASFEQVSKLIIKKAKPNKKDQDLPTSQKMKWLESHQKLCEEALNEDNQRIAALEQTSYDGTIVWKITNYERHKRDSLRAFPTWIASHPFYTNRFGYKLCLRVYLNGFERGHGTHVSVLLVIMKGKYDSMLQWPFREKVTLTLLDQGAGRLHHEDSFRFNSNNSSFEAPNSDIGLGSGSLLFISHKDLENREFIKDDTIFIKARIGSS